MEFKVSSRCFWSGKHPSSASQASVAREKCPLAFRNASIGGPIRAVLSVSSAENLALSSEESLRADLLVVSHLPEQLF